MKPDDLAVLIDSGVPLPDDVVRAGRAVAVLEAVELPPAPKEPNTRDAIARMVNDLLTAAENGEAVAPDVAALVEADKALDRWRAEQTARADAAQVVKRARGEAMTNAADSLREHADEVCDAITRLLQDVVDEARKIAPDVRGLTLGSAVKASEKVRKAWVRLDELADRYRQLRVCQAAVAQAAGGAGRDEWGFFLLFRNLTDLWPGESAKKVALQGPWPSDPRELLEWLASSDGARYEVWAPSPAQRDRRYDEVFGPKVAGKMPQGYVPRAVGV